MRFKSFREESKSNWGITIDRQPTNEEIQLGAILRIADASEKMASNYTSLQADRDRYKKRSEEKSEEIDRLHRRITSLKGVITKLKKQAQATNEKL